MKRIITITAFIFLMIGIATGCLKDVSNPETKSKIVLVKQQRKIQTETIPVYNQNLKEIPTLYVHHKINDKQVLVECIVTGISFRETDRTKQKVGKLVVWVDGKRNFEVDSAAFIIKGLPAGSHKLKLEVVKLNNESYGLAKEFMVNIPK
ncbi:hypothetical protein [Neobacillus sp.]|uniref:hypothetical protein n=1 Tax=Neobacillus sp. TaxID=2675273 RepID=UPI00289EE882|nr:hypothetical protein [Neobacillus sp.]